MEQDRAAKLLSKLVLRLDDGTLIKAGGGEGGEGGPPAAACVLKPAEAYSRGSLTEAHLLKAQALLCEVHAKLPEEGPLRSLSLGSKRSVDTGYHPEVGPTLSGKRSRSLGGPFANGTDDMHMESPTSGMLPPGKGLPAKGVAPPGPPAAAAYHAPPPQPAAQLQPPLPVHYAPPVAAHAPPPMPAGPSRAEWTAACSRIVDNIVKNLGPVDSPIFYNAVDPKMVPDYHQVVRTPVCLKDIKDRLATAAYAGPEGFYADMDQLVYNCLLYNPVGTYVRSLGQKIEQRWLDNWRRNPILSQFQVSRMPKPAAGKPAPKSRGVGAAPRPQRSSGGAARRAPPKAQGGGAAAAGAARVPRTTSVNSYKNYQALPPEQQAQLAEALGDENVLAAKMDGVVAILQRANQLPTNEEGEVELDLSVLSPGVVWELYEFVLGKPPAVAAPAGAAGAAAQPARSSFQLQEDSDYDPYGEEEED